MIDASYSDKEQQYFEYPRTEMLAFVPVTSAKVLEIGCGRAGFAQLLKARGAVHVTAIEAHAESAVWARQRVDRLLDMPIEDAIPALQGQEFDCIVLNDVLEHLVDPWKVLAALRGVLSAEGRIVASLPNVRYLPVFKDYVLRGQWRYQQDGVLDRTHLRFFTRTAMRELFESTGFAVEHVQGINATNVSWKFHLLNALARSALDDTRFKQFACVARRSPAAAA